MTSHASDTGKQIALPSFAPSSLTVSADLLAALRSADRLHARRQARPAAMRLPCLLCYLSLFVPALAASSRRGYEDLESKLKKISMEKSSFLQQLSKSTPDLQGMKGSLQINFLKAEVERKSKLIKDLQQENKSLKNKLLSGNKQCGIHAEESKRIQSQLKELRYGKKDLIFKAQQLTDLERKLLAAKQELEKTEGDKESQLKALKEVARLCVSGVLKNQSPFMSIVPPRNTENGILLTKNTSRFPSYQPATKLLAMSQTEDTNSPNKEPFLNEAMKNNDQDVVDCSLHKAGKNCSSNQDNNPPTK
ncbi:leucine zipper protein 2 isoform X2 [Rhinoraja longicauda]